MRISKLAGVFVFWRLGLFLVAAFAGIFFTYDPTFPYANQLLASSNLPQWLYSWANFDGVHYLTIILDGYLNIDLIQAFFPVYPLGAKIITFFGLQPIVSGLLFANLAAFLLIIVWYKFLKTFLSQRAAVIGIFLLLSFPTSFYLGAMYSESLFILLVIGAFYASREKRWWLMGLMTVLATGTRVVGIVLVPALILDIYLQTNNIKTAGDLYKHWHNEKFISSIGKVLKNQKGAIIAALLGSVGLMIYMIFLQFNFSDPFYFFSVQEEFGGGRSEELVLYPQVVWRYLKILATNTLNWRYLTAVQEALAGIAGMIGLLAALQNVRLSYVLFSLGIFIIPTLTGTFSSMPRYILPCFALFILLAQFFEKREKLLYVYLLISTILLAINTMLFVQGYWVA